MAIDLPDNRHNLNFYGVLSPEAFSVGMQYHYMLNPYFGIGAGIGLWGDPDDMSELMYVDDYYGCYDCYPYYDDTDYDNIALFFEPSLLMRTKALHLGTMTSLGLEFNPWLRVSTHHYCDTSVPRSGVGSGTIDVAYRSRTVAVGVRLGPTLHIGSGQIGIGYEISNLDVDRRYNSGGHTYRRLPQHGVYFNIAFNF